MVIKQLADLQKEIHQTNVEKGFWPADVVRNRGEMVVLMITELSEAVEAHREGKEYDPITRLRKEAKTMWAWEIVDTSDEAWKNWFTCEVKNSLQDELADTVIRILDYCYGWKIPLSLTEHHFYMKENFGESIVELIEYILRAYRTDVPRHLCIQGSWSVALQMIISFCEQMNIDILQHVQWKLKYNKTRAFKHGKNY